MRFMIHTCENAVRLDYMNRFLIPSMIDQGIPDPGENRILLAGLDDVRTELLSSLFDLFPAESVVGDAEMLIDFGR